jgi:hypothetical protein
MARENDRPPGCPTFSCDLHGRVGVWSQIMILKLNQIIDLIFLFGHGLSGKPDSIFQDRALKS